MESTTFFFSNIDSDFIEKEKFACLEDFSEENEQQIYIISRPLSEKKYDYTVNKVLILLSPGYKILFVNLGLSEAEFNEIYLDFIEDLGHIADKYNYTEIISRPRYWSQFILKVNSREIFFEGISSKENLERLFEENIISDQEEQFKEIEALIKAKRTVKLLITLLIGSINSAEKLGKEPPSSILQKIKKNIILFDGDQTRFIFREKYEDKIIKLQGLAGTGKTELLLHRLKEIYTTEKNSKIILTCQSKTLANILKTRVTEFFNFMRVEEQIQWEERLWVMHSWGSTRHTYNLGTYALLCREYQLPFYSYNDCSFATACEKTLKYIKESAIEYEPIFDYILVDEGQDFTPAFIELCAMFTKEKVFVAGDIFQDIFGIQNMESEPHYLLNKCYRTDSRTLMFSHALGLGWFEDKSLRFLEDDEWHSCGYFYEDKGNSYVIKREPVKRFDEIVDIKDIPSIDILAYSGDDSREIILDTIEEIIEKYDDVEASDIVIVYPNSHLRYRKIDELELAIYKRFNLKSNLLYNTKDKEFGKINISNRNNIKGLEFPFVICVVDYAVTDDFKLRNTLYMSLTRSFLTSYLVIDSDMNSELVKTLEDGLAEIKSTESIEVIKPPKEVLDEQKTMIKRYNTETSQDDVITAIFDELKIGTAERTKTRDVVKMFRPNVTDYAELKGFIANLLGVKDVH